MIFGYTWQTAALYAALALTVTGLLWRFHTSSIYKNFCLIHAVANREGFYDPDRAHLTGSFLIAAFAVIVSVIRDHVDSQVVLLVGGLVSAFALKSGWSYTVSRRTEADVREAEINRGRRTDVDGLTVEEEEEQRKQRRKTDPKASLLK
jgi:hypothetical protein